MKYSKKSGRRLWFILVALVLVAVFVTAVFFRERITIPDQLTVTVAWNPHSTALSAFVTAEAMGFGESQD